MYFFGVAGTVDSSDMNIIIEPAAEQLNAFQRWWSSLDWDAIIGLIIQKSISLIFIILLDLIQFLLTKYWLVVENSLNFKSKI